MAEAYCKRPFKKRRFRFEKHFKGNGRFRGKKIFLNAQPLVHIYSIYDGFETLIQEGTAEGGSTTTLIDSALVESDDFWNNARIEVDVAGGGFVENVVTDFEASNDTITMSNTFASNVATGNAYTITLCDVSNNQRIDNQTDRVLSINRDSGIIELFGNYNRLAVDYEGGYTTVPENLKRAVKIMVLDFLDHNKIGKTSSTYGGQSANYFTETAEDLIPPKARSLLNAFARKVW